MTRLTDQQIAQTRQLASRAATCAMDYYQQAYEVSLKGDSSPVTQADLAVSELLEEQLPQIADFPVLSEENQPSTAVWLNWQTYWLVDPIDGTKHFINQTGEFCVCIALIHQHEPVFGLIIAPTTKEMWVGQMPSAGAAPLLAKYRDGVAVPLPTAKTDVPTAVLGPKKLSSRMKTLLSVFPDYHWYSRGSALKFIDIVEGRANLYPKMWDICEWDCAAGHCLLRCADGEILRFADAQPLRYGDKENLLCEHFFAYKGVGDEVLSELEKIYRILPPFVL